MRVIVLADLPDGSRHERKVARAFRNELHALGFTRLQESVFTRIVDGRDSAELFEKRLRERRPETGMVRVLTLTERQFASSLLIAGTDAPQELEVGSQLDVFL